MNQARQLLSSNCSHFFIFFLTLSHSLRLLIRVQLKFYDTKGGNFRPALVMTDLIKAFDRIKYGKQLDKFKKKL